MFIEGLNQQLQYGMSTERLWYKLIHEGRLVTSTTTITLQIWTPDGDTKLLSSASMTLDANGMYYKTLDLSDTDSWDDDTDYIAQVDYTISSVKIRKNFYFDVVLHPFNDPLVTSEYIDEIHPDWKRMHPSGASGTWTQAIETAHAELSRRARAAGAMLSSVPKMATELFPYAVAFTEAEIAKRLTRMTAEDRSFYIQAAENLWKSRGEMSFDSDDDAEIDEDPRTLAQPRKTR